MCSPSYEVSRLGMHSKVVFTPIDLARKQPRLYQRYDAVCFLIEPIFWQPILVRSLSVHSPRLIPRIRCATKTSHMNPASASSQTETEPASHVRWNTSKTPARTRVHDARQRLNPDCKEWSDLKSLLLQHRRRVQRVCACNHQPF